MKRRMHLVLVVLAILIIGIQAGVSTASADMEFHTESNAEIEGYQVNQLTLTIQGSSVTCNVANLSGKASAGGSTSTQELHPEYSNCKAFGFTGATVTTKECNFRFHAETEAVEGENEPYKYWDIICNAAYQMTVAVNTAFGNCVVDISNKTRINGMNYVTKTGPPADMTWSFSATNLNFVVTTSTGLCPLTVTSGANGTYNGVMTVKAKNGLNLQWY